MATLHSQPLKKDETEYSDCSPPPLSIWLYAIVISGLFLFTFSYIGRAFIPKIPEPIFKTGINNRLNSYKHLKQEKTDNKQRSYVFLGTSRIKHAFIYSDKEALSTHGITMPENTPSTLLLPLNWGGFERLGITASDIIDLHPNAVILQADLLTYDFNFSGKGILLKQWMKMNLFNLQQHGKEKVGLFGSVTHELSKGSCDNSISPLKRYNDFTSLMSENPNSTGPKKAFEFVKQIVTSGIDVYIVTIPKSAALEKLSPSLSKKMSDTIKQLQSISNNVHFLEPQTYTDSTFFCDAAHLNKKGALKWRNWLFKQLDNRAQKWTLSVRQ